VSTPGRPATAPGNRGIGIRSGTWPAARPTPFRRTQRGQARWLVQQTEPDVGDPARRRASRSVPRDSVPAGQG